MATPAQTNGRHTPTATLAAVDAVKSTIDELNAVREFVSAQLKPTVDFGTIPGTPKPTLYQTGAQKILMYFNCYPSPKFRRTRLKRGHLEVVVKTSLVHRQSGAVIGVGIGSATTMESKHRWRSSKRCCPKCGVEAIIAGREDYGGGWLCYKAKEGCGAKFKIDDPSIVDQVIGKALNEEIYDTHNTVLKMAKKRSVVDAALGLSCVSEFYTQDLEDFAHEDRPRENRGDRTAGEGSGPTDSRAAATNGHASNGHAQTGEPRSNGRQEPPRNTPPPKTTRSGKDLFKWLQDAGRAHGFGLLDYVQSWGKTQGLQPRVVDWSAGQAAQGLEVAKQKLQELTNRGDAYEEPAP